MTPQVIVYKGRTTILPVSIGYDVSNDVITSEIRVDKDRESDLLVTWDVSFLTDGVDGEIILTIDNSEVDDIEKATGYMDIKRFTGGEPISVFDDPLEVLFKNTITV